MGRCRKGVNKSLPVGMYYNKKGDTFYLRSKIKGDINLGKIKATALQKYYGVIGEGCEGYTVAGLVERYMLEESPKRSASMHKTSIPRAGKLIAAFGEFPLEELTTRDIQLYLDYRRKTPVDANRTVALLSAMYGAALRWGYIDRIPFEKIKFHQEVTSDRLLEDSEVVAFKEFCPHWLCLYVDLKYSTGLRQKDMLELTTESWRPSVGGLFVQASKSRHRTCFTVCNELASLMKEIQLEAAKKWTKGAGVKPLFPTLKGKAYTPDGYRSIWYKCMQKAVNSGKLKKSFREHDIRSLAATKCPELEHARKLLGHKNVSTTLRHYRKGFEHVMPNTNANSTHSYVLFK